MSKENEFTFGILTSCIKKSIKTGSFPYNLKEENITPIFKKGHPLDKSRDPLEFHLKFQDCMKD